MDVLSPGTSTIHTRARYFFFIPWIYGPLEERRMASERAHRKGARWRDQNRIRAAEVDQLRRHDRKTRGRLPQATPE